MASTSQTPTNDPDHMRRMGDWDKSIRYWATREVLWNGERVVVEAPRMNLPATDTGD